MMVRKRLGITLEEEFLEALDTFRNNFVRLDRSEAIETMLFYCLSHEDVLKEIGDALEAGEIPDDWEIKEEEEEEQKYPESTIQEFRRRQEKEMYGEEEEEKD